jgi:hypothetical protein
LEEKTYALLELLVDGIQGILDVPRDDLKAEREVQGDLLELGRAQWQFEDSRVFDLGR